jgi:uncharacterized coiled-coil DUF342 family protein
MSTSGPPEATPVAAPDLRDELRAELEKTRELYMELVALTNQSNWNNQSGNSAWTVGQVMGHIVMIFGAIPMKMERLRKGKGLPGLPKFLFDPLNAFSTRMATRKYTPDNIRAAYDEAHQNALETLNGIQEHEWDLSAKFFGVHQDTAELFHYHAKHVREHEPDVRAGV